jgi:hypothetical protein
VLVVVVVLVSVEIPVFWPVVGRAAVVALTPSDFLKHQMLVQQKLLSWGLAVLAAQEQQLMATMAGLVGIHLLAVY